MKKFYKIAVLTFICLFITANTSCSFFSAIGKIFVRVTGGAAGENNSFIMDAYLCEAGDDEDSHGHGPQIDKVTAKDLKNNEDSVFSFENPVREGTVVKVFLYLKTKAIVGGTERHYYRAESEPFVVQEGVNTPVFSAWELVTNSSEVWWY